MAGKKQRKNVGGVRPLNPPLFNFGLSDHTPRRYQSFFICAFQFLMCRRHFFLGLSTDPVMILFGFVVFQCFFEAGPTALSSLNFVLVDIAKVLARLVD